MLAQKALGTDINKSLARVARRVALVTRYPPMGSVHSGRGIGSYSKFLAEAVSKAGWDVTVIADKREGDPALFTDGTVDVRRVWREGWHAIRDIADACDKLDLSVVHVQHELFAFGRRAGSLVAPLVLRRLQQVAPVVTTIHGVVPYAGFSRTFASAYAGTIPRWIVRAVYRHIIQSVVGYSTIVVVPTNEVLDSLREYCLPKHSTVVPHGVPYRPSALLSRVEGLKALGMSEKQRVVFLGFLLPYKGIETLEAAVPRLREKGIEVVIAGGVSGDDRPTHVLGRPREAGAVRLGFVPEQLLPALFAISDVMVFPYTMGLSASGPLMLAAQYDVPVVVSDVPTLAATLRCPAATFRAGDPVDLTSVVLRVLSDRVIRAEVLDRLAELREDNSWFVTGRRFIRCYEEAILAGKR